MSSGRLFTRSTGLLRSNRALPRAFATRVQTVEPQQVYDEVNAGNGVLVDLRADDSGLKLHADAVRMPHEAIIGSDRGANPPSSTGARSDLLAQLTPEQLGAAAYHAQGNNALAAVQAASGDAKLSHAQAQKWVSGFLNTLRTPSTFVAASTKALASAGASGDVVAQAGALREKFQRYLSLQPSTRTRFDKPLSGKAAADQKFADEFLQDLRVVYGEKSTHESVHAALKKRVSSADLKSDTTFAKGPFVEWTAAYNKSSAKQYSDALADFDPEDVDDLVAARADLWSSYLKYDPEASKEKLAESISDAELSRLAGEQNTNLGATAAQTLAESAKAALSQLPAARPLYLCCNLSAHSSRVAAALANAGAGDVRIVAGGVDRWVANGVPFVADDAVENSMEARVQKTVGERRQQIGDINE